jgi:2-keto-4-pentenoate hydratase/2-oxohepta-3-ene-1,7-dioic acid hydratase in catechol pathway
MKLTNIHWHGHVYLGVRLQGGVLPVTDMAPIYGVGSRLPRVLHDVLADPSALLRLQDRIAQGTDMLADKVIPEERVRYAPAVTHPGKILCIGLNYRKHAAETKAEVPTIPIVFSKFSNALAAHREDIPMPRESTQVDYEGELVIVMGRRARSVSEAQALDYVLGYTVGNDVSARDLQKRTSQWLIGKSLDRFAPLGPDIVTADEIGDPNRLNLRTFVNGQVRQESNTSDMVFSCREIISYISRHIDLEPGDVIMTGTPEGVILGKPHDERVWIQAGDRVEVEIEGVGRLHNAFVEAGR